MFGLVTQNDVVEQVAQTGRPRAQEVRSDLHGDGGDGGRRRRGESHAN